jgi:hypothetical protein
MMPIEAYYGVWKKEFGFTMDGKDYDLSTLVPEEVWNIGERKFPLHPQDDWLIRVKLRKIFIKYFKKNIDKKLRASDVIF